jgi:hypothetical protein
MLLAGGKGWQVMAGPPLIKLCENNLFYINKHITLTCYKKVITDMYYHSFVYFYNNIIINLYLVSLGILYTFIQKILALIFIAFFLT